MPVPLKIVLWKWSDPRWPSTYGPEHVNVIADSVSRNLKIPHEIICITDDARGIDPSVGIIPIWSEFSAEGHCYRRLAAFSDSEEMLADLGPRFVSLDLDSCIVGDLTPLFAGDEEFKIAKDSQPGTPYNGSMFMLQAGKRPAVYHSYKADPAGARAMALHHGYAACDQAIIAEVLGVSEATWSVQDGVFSFRNEIMRKHAGKLPDGARIVFFHGRPKPFDPAVLQTHEWVRKNYRRSRRHLLVIGGASCVWDDLKAFGPVNCDVMVINDMGVDYKGPIKFWASLHPEKFKPIWRPKRIEGNQDYKTVGYNHHHTPPDADILSDDWGGSSGLFACKMGLEFGYDQITLCGVPMTPTPHYFDKPQDPWSGCSGFRSGWKTHLDKIVGKVFSMSGWTKEILGFKKFEA